MSEFKVGDIVRIVKNSSSGSYGCIGQTAEVVRASNIRLNTTRIRLLSPRENQHRRDFGVYTNRLEKL